MATRSFFAALNPVGAAITSNGVPFVVAPHGRPVVALASTSVSFYQYRAAVPFTLTNLQITTLSTTSGAGRIVSVLKNEVAEALSVTFPDGALTFAQRAKNSSDGVAFAAGDKFGLSAVRGSGAMVFLPSALITAPGAQAISPLLASGVATWTTASNRRIPLSGQLNLISTASTEQVAMRASTPATIRGLFLYVTANASTGAAVGTVEVEKDGALTGLKIDVGVGETGYFFENATPIALDDGDFVGAVATGTTGNSVTISAVGATLVSDSRAFDVYDIHARTFTAANAAGGIYIGVAGGDPGGASPAVLLPALEYPLEFPARISRLATYASNGTDVAFAVDVLVNGSPCGITIPLPAGTALGSHSDDVNSYVAAAGDKVALRCAPTGAAPTSGTLVWYSHSLQFEDLTAPQWRPRIIFHN